MLTVRIETDNAAFADGDVGPELHRILHALGGRLHTAVFGDYMSIELFDSNGNRVGSATYEDK